MTQTPTPETYHFFQQAYDYFNRTLFEGVLPPCLITFQRQKRLMGYVSFKRWFNRSEQRYIDELAINPEYFAHYPLIEIFQTLFFRKPWFAFFPCEIGWIWMQEIHPFLERFF